MIEERQRKGGREKFYSREIEREKGTPVVPKGERYEGARAGGSHEEEGRGRGVGMKEGGERERE